MTKTAAAVSSIVGKRAMTPSTDSPPRGVVPARGPFAAEAAASLGAKPKASREGRRCASRSLWAYVFSSFYSNFWLFFGKL